MQPEQEHCMLDTAGKNLPPTKPGLRMKDLVEASGVPKSTILYYLQQGLLPEPVKTSHNMAYYDPQCITRIRYIQNLQRRHRLSLSEIRQMLETQDEDADLSIYIELNDIIFGPTDTDELLDAAEFCRVSGLTATQLQTLLKKKLMMPLAKGLFDQDDVRMGQIYAQILSNGLDEQDLTYYVDLGEKIVDHEMILRRRITHHLPDEVDAALSMELVKYARMTRSYVIDRLFQHRIAGMRDLKEEQSR